MGHQQLTMGGSSDNAFDLLLAGVGIIAYGLLSMLSEYLPQYLSSQHIGLTIMIASTVGSLITAYCSIIGGYQHVDFSLLLEVGFFAVGLMWYKFRGHVRPVKGMEALFVGLAFACSVFEKGDVLEPNPNVIPRSSAGNVARSGHSCSSVYFRQAV